MDLGGGVQWLFYLVKSYYSFRKYSFFIRETNETVMVIRGKTFKAGVHLKAVFWLGIMFLMQISHLRFKQSRIAPLITHIYVLGCFVNFFGDF